MSIKDWFKGILNNNPLPPPSPPPAPAVEPDLPASEYTRDTLQFDMEYNGRPLCLRPFFDVNSASDQRLTGIDDDLYPLETDNLKFFRMIADPAFLPHNHGLVYQQWGPEQIADDGSSSRSYYWLDRPTAQAIGTILRDSPVQTLILVFTMPQPGALQELAEKIGPDRLKTLTLCWYFSGDDCSDNPGTLQETGRAATTLGLESLTILTSAWNQNCDEALLRGLGHNQTLRSIRILRKDDEYKWPDIKCRATKG